MSTTRWMLSVLLILTLLAPGASIAQPAASPAGSITPEITENWPWQTNQFIASYATLPECTQQSEPAIAVDAASNANLVDIG